jgi:hypothetical protein
MHIRGHTRSQDGYLESYLESYRWGDKLYTNSYQWGDKLYKNSYLEIDGVGFLTVMGQGVGAVRFNGPAT